MKHLFFVAVATGIFTGTSITAKAQTNVNIERLNVKAKPANAPKFINNIEITPGRVFNDDLYYSTEDQSAAPAVAVKEIKTTLNISSSSFGTVIENCSSLQFKYAMLMDREVESFTNLLLYNFIEDWWGTRYCYGGTDKKGVDCSSFTGQLMQSIYHINLPRTAKEQYHVCDKVTAEDLKEGDLVFFNTRGGVSHVGFYLGNNYFVHSSVRNGVTISSLTDDYYSEKFISGGKPKVQ